MTLNIVVAPPMPTASVTIAGAEEPGLLTDASKAVIQVPQKGAHIRILAWERSANRILMRRCEIRRRGRRTNSRVEHHVNGASGRARTCDPRLEGEF
jgi:hypothetical protein